MNKETKPKTYPKNKFDILKNHIESNIEGTFGYCVLNPEEPITKELFGDIGHCSFVVAATTASNLHFTEYKCQGYTVAKGKPSIVLRKIRYDDTGHNGTAMHFNNEYFALIPTPKGSVLQIKLEANNFDKHFIKLVDNTKIDETLKSMLPLKKTGSIEEYYSNPKSPYVNIEPIKESE